MKVKHYVTTRGAEAWAGFAARCSQKEWGKMYSLEHVITDKFWIKL